MSTNDEKFPLIPLAEINIVERPESGQEHNVLFFNPRDSSSFDPDEMLALVRSIQIDGLQQPIVVRAVKGKKYELIAGERRFRSITRIFEENLPCYDEDAKLDKIQKDQTIVISGKFAKVRLVEKETLEVVILDNNLKPTSEVRTIKRTDNFYPTVGGRELYKNVRCKVHYDCNDERALRLAFAENDKHSPLKIHEEIALVERLLRRGLPQGQISDLLGRNETWISHTLGFRSAMPAPAFQKLIEGHMTRNVAVKIMSFKAEDRERLYREACVIAEKDRKEKLSELSEEQERCENELDILDEQIKNARGKDIVTERKSKRQKESVKGKMRKIKDKKDKIKKTKGQLTSSDIQKASAMSGIVPRKSSKTLTKEEIEQYYIDGLERYMESDMGSPSSHKFLILVHDTAKAILNGERNPMKIVKDFMCANDIDAEEDDEDSLDKVIAGSYDQDDFTDYQNDDDD